MGYAIAAIPLTKSLDTAAKFVWGYVPGEHGVVYTADVMKCLVIETKIQAVEIAEALNAASLNGSFTHAVFQISAEESTPTSKLSTEDLAFWEKMFWACINNRLDELPMGAMANTWIAECARVADKCTDEYQKRRA